MKLAPLLEKARCLTRIEGQEPKLAKVLSRIQTQSAETGSH